LPIFSEKNWRFSQKPILWSLFCIITFGLSQKRLFFVKFFCEKF
jgi:hypothetical protein